jgi:predicted RecB family nuclease
MHSTQRITAQDFYDFDKCPHRVYLNRFGDPREKLPHSDFLNMLFENALTHEQDVVREMRYETPTGSTLEERAASTLELMRAGAERIYQGVLLQAGESGIPDLLERADGHSKLGRYFYRPVDIKAGSGYANPDKGTLRDDYGMQLFHYALLLEGVQGTFPPDAYILNRERERVLYTLNQFKTAYFAALSEIRALVAGEKADEPALSGDCGACQWWGLCEKALVAANDVSLLPDIGRSKKIALNGVGIRSIANIPPFDFSLVDIKGVGQKTVDSMKRAAISMLSNKIQVLSKPVLPDPPRKIYLDFEDDPSQDLIYLCGMWIDPAWDGLNYHGMFCTDEAGEARIWHEFQRLCAAVADEDYVVYHYSPYERVKLESLERKYGLEHREAVGIFRGRMVDLFPVVKQSVVVPARGYGLKKIAPFVGLNYSAENAGGAQSIVWFRKYQQDQGRADVLELLLQYNEEDCLAMRAVESWLRTL